MGLKQTPHVNKTSKRWRKKGRHFRRVNVAKYPPLPSLHPWCGPPPRCDQLLHSLGWTSLHQANANRGEEFKSVLLPSNLSSSVLPLSDPLLWALWGNAWNGSPENKSHLTYTLQYPKSCSPWLNWKESTTCHRLPHDQGKTFLLVTAVLCKNQHKEDALLLPFLVPKITLGNSQLRFLFLLNTNSNS